MLKPEAHCLIFLVLSLLFLYSPGFGHPLVPVKAGTGSLQSSLYRSKDMQSCWCVLDRQGSQEGRLRNRTRMRGWQMPLVLYINSSPKEAPTSAPLASSGNLLEMQILWPPLWNQSLCWNPTTWALTSPASDGGTLPKGTWFICTAITVVLRPLCYYPYLLPTCIKTPKQRHT